MAVQSGKSELFAKYGAKLDQAVKQHAGDEYKSRGQSPPPGIRNGVARLTECVFGKVDAGKDYAGEWYFRASGTVVSPKTVIVDGAVVQAEGCQTSIIEMVCDTKTKSSPPKVTTMQEHVANILNHMRGLGADTTTATGADMEGIAAALTAAAKQPPGIFFKFTTTLSKGGGIDPKTKLPYPPRVFENWNGPAEPVETDIAAGIDESPEATGFNETANDSLVPPTDGDAQTAAGEEPDFEALLADANGDNANGSQAILERLAIEAGKTEDEVNKAANWEEVVSWIQGDTIDDEPAVDAEPTELIPKKGDIFEYEVLRDVKNPKKGKKKVDIEVLTSDPAKKVVTVKSLETGKPLNDATGKKAKVIEWDSLIVKE